MIQIDCVAKIILLNGASNLFKICKSTYLEVLKEIGTKIFLNFFKIFELKITRTKRKKRESVP